MPPPILPGIQDKNSSPDIECCCAKSAIFLSKTAAPTSILLFSIKFIWEKAFPSLIMTPLKPESLKRVFDPAPSMYIFFSYLR